jgi:hypothetical protein
MVVREGEISFMSISYDQNVILCHFSFIALIVFFYNELKHT